MTPEDLLQTVTKGSLRDAHFIARHKLFAADFDVLLRILGCLICPDDSRHWMVTLTSVTRAG
jgi:hypothetical protein